MSLAVRPLRPLNASMERTLGEGECVRERPRGRVCV